MMMMRMGSLDLCEERGGVRIDRLHCGFHLFMIGLRLFPEGFLVVGRGVLVLVQGLSFLAKAFALGLQVGIGAEDLVEVLFELGLFIGGQGVAPIAVMMRAGAAAT